MDHSPPLVSAIMPVYNGEAYLGEAIESVLAQTYPSIELLVVDDASTDGSAQVARSFGKRVKLLSRENGGPAAARNTGLEQAAGELVAFLDADDRWLPHKTAGQAAYLEAHPHVDMVTGLARQFASPELPPDERRRLQRDGAVMKGYFAGAVMVRRSVFDRYGIFDPAWTASEFIEWFKRVEHRGATHELVEEVVVERRLHGANRSLQERKPAAEEFLRLARGMVQRNRGDTPSP